MLIIKKDDYEFLFMLLDKDKQAALASAVTNQEDSIVIDDEDIEVDLYDWLNDLVVEKGMNKNNEVNDTGKQLEELSDYVFSVIEK